MLNVNLQQGNCLELMKDVPDKSIDMILCDLPYGTTKNKWDIVIPFDKLWEQYKRIIKDHGAICLFGTNPFSAKLICSNLNWYKHEWIWEKQKASNFMQAKYAPLKYHEDILVFGEPGKLRIFNPQRYRVTEIQDIMGFSKKEMEYFFRNRQYDTFGKIDRRKTNNNPKTNKVFEGTSLKRTRTKDTGYRNPKSIIKINKSINKNSHPTQKPVALLEYLIKTYTNENDLVLDNCMGSGSTGVACANTNRNFIGMELDPKYFKIAKERINNAKC